MKQLATYSYLSAYRNNNNAKGNLKEHVKETESEASRILPKRDKWNIIKTECRERRDQGQNRTL